MQSSSSSNEGETRQRKWDRAVERRSREAQQLKSEVVETILRDSQLDHFFQAAGSVKGKSPPIKVGALLLFFYNRASDPTASVTVRRSCWDHIQTLRKQLDDALKRPENLLGASSTTTSTSTIATTKTTSTATTPAVATTTTAAAAVGPTATTATGAETTKAAANTKAAAAAAANSIPAEKTPVIPPIPPTTSTTSKKTSDANASLSSKKPAGDSLALRHKKLTSGALSRTIAVPPPLPKKSIASYAAASAATTQLASSLSMQDDAISSQSNTTQQATAQGPLQNGSSGQSSNKQQVLPIDLPPPAYQRHSEIATATNLVTKKRPATADSTTNGSKNVSLSENDKQERDPNRKSKKQKLTTSTTIRQQNGGSALKTTTNHQVPPRLLPIQPVLQLDPRKEDPPHRQLGSEVSSLVLQHQFPADIIVDRGSTSRFSGSRMSRPHVTLEFTRQWPGNRMLADAGAAFEQWEPFWKTEKVVATGITSVVRNLAWTNHPTWDPISGFKNVPRTVAQFRIPPFTGRASKQIKWGTTKLHANTITPSIGDMVLVLRMLPITVDRKHKRANCHLWPKGTFLMVNQVPVALNQRIQVSNDATKWEKMSYPLDLSSHIRNCNESTIVALCCQDDTQYLYMVAICRYKPPFKLLKELVQQASPYLLKMTFEESVEKAMGYMNKNSMITIDDGDDGDRGGNGAGKLVFSLVDPVTKTPMKIPVRGRRCKHWQCFDLESFLSVNASVSGGRWRCICCESFITYQELEVCGLTLSALQTFATEVSATRDRIEFRADKSFRLLNEAPLRHKNRQRQKESSVKDTYSDVLGQSLGRGAVTHETIEIIDLDD